MKGWKSSGGSLCREQARRGLGSFALLHAPPYDTVRAGSGWPAVRALYVPCFSHRWQRALRIGTATGEEAAGQGLEHVARHEAEPRELRAAVAVDATVRRAVLVH